MLDRVKSLLRLTRLSDAYKKCFLDDEGELTTAAKLVLRDLGEYGHMNKTILKVSPITRTTDPMATGAAEGRRDIVRRIWAYIKLDPNMHPLTKEQDE